MMSNTDGHSSRRREGGIGRLVSWSGWLVLCVSFFLPQVKGCTEPIIPAREAVGGGEEVPYFIFTHGLPFLVAILAALWYLLRALARSDRFRRKMTAVLCATLLAGLAAGAAMMSREVFVDDFSWNGTDEILWGITTLLAIVGLLWSIAGIVFARGKTPPVVLACGLAGLGYFLCYGIFYRDPVYYGLWVSVAGFGLVTVGGLWEMLRPARAH